MIKYFNAILILNNKMIVRGFDSLILLKKIIREYKSWKKIFIDFVNFKKYNIPKNVPRSTSFRHNRIGVVINKRAILGENCSIGQNVTIGWRKNGVPTIEDNVQICANSCIIGDIRIGHHSVIGAGATITKDVPPLSLAVGYNKIYAERYKNNIDIFNKLRDKKVVRKITDDEREIYYDEVNEHWAYIDDDKPVKKSKLI